jgi:hypothetical protein
MVSKPIAVFSGDTFRNLIKSYSFNRMERDPKYRREVRQFKAARKAARKPNAEKTPITIGDTAPSPNGM